MPTFQHALKKIIRVGARFSRNSVKLSAFGRHGDVHGKLNIYIHMNGKNSEYAPNLWHPCIRVRARDRSQKKKNPKKLTTNNFGQHRQSDDVTMDDQLMITGPDGWLAAG